MWSHIGVTTLGDLGDYFRQFIAITTYLCDKNRLSATEQSRTFVRAFSLDFRSRILHRLQLKFPDHLPDDPHSLSDIYDAAQFFLYGTTASLSACPPVSDAPIALSLPSHNLRVEKLGTSTNKRTTECKQAQIPTIASPWSFQLL